ncbi:hypothetical protein RB2501_01680 [Robiginitalea biformata HTCC2501]|uniref:Uncharacterized protein n=1 Tax=Robiginitalea biformata (strain ATCC BAA-864 / DSM 15991 / KCTC 12146 / HTCC2501) TaxID=313596 RepID=A4CQ11_ROBBH|nr:hypothetical protein RB2501_01680 [Robiginitalea biformata HTCC2501]
MVFGSVPGWEVQGKLFKNKE